MARKDRAPAPPKRPVQAPQRRSTPASPADLARQKRLLYLVAGSGVLALAVVLGLIFLAGGGDDSEAAILADNGCELTSYPGQEGTHVTSLTAKPKPPWNSSPPTSGTHLVTQAVWGSYDEPVPLIQSVHNLEHGGIVIHYGSAVPQAEIEKIRAWYTDDPNGLIVAPLASLGETIALTAWTAPARVGGAPDNGRGYLAKCTAFSEKAFDTFKDEHRGQGPERFPVEQLTPGS
jgi:hypothetical protein